ncbi:DUF3105 domain-containing protein [Streptomyces fulvorobeus]|uniref:Membrane protein n=1 Tax=Streptomyces fulvorobeus TaxID=284028 RepID=A0A7J0C464_9ACTN|nr:DUF3105 domain-containing protein [Streptomyces fulvorobeus]NYE40441.1 hypothetical protein [Streptomyces fulvorobeus]GFM96723.1 membrane protein [Streptomyces fulvorobeus]
MSFDHTTPTEQTHDADRARDRGNRVVAIALSALVVAGLAGVGSYLVLDRSEAKEQRPDAAAQDGKQPGADPAALVAEPVRGEKSWDPEKLTRNHVAGEVAYAMKPPVGGDHNQAWLNCDGVVYEKAVRDVNAVHSLEHGAVWVTYNGKAADADVRELARRVGSTPFSLMSPYEDQAGTIMLSAWGKQLTVDGADDRRVAQFFAKYVQGAQTPEPGAPCTGGIGAA